MPRPAGPRDDDTRLLPAEEHWARRHPDHHRTRRPGRRRSRVVLVSAVATALVFGGMYAAALALEGQVPKGTVVDGVGIGGLSRADAEAKLSAALAPKLAAPLRLTADGTAFELLPEAAGLHVDYAGTVAAAASGRSDPLVAVPALIGKGRDVPLRVTVDRAALRDAIAKATAGFDKAMVDGGVTFPGGVPTPIAPRPGRQVDLDAAVNAVADAFAQGVASVHLAAMGRSGTSPTAAAGTALPADRLATAPVGYAIPEKSALAPSPDAVGPKRSPSPAPSPTQSPTPTVTPATAPSPSTHSGPLQTPAPSATPAPKVPAAPSPATAGAAAGAPSFPAPPVTLIVHDLQPTVTPAAVAQAMQDLARPAMSGPVTLVTGSVKTVFKPAVLGRYLAIVPDGRGGLTPRLDGVGIRGEIDHDALAKLEQPPVEAAFTVTGGKPVLLPGHNGTGYAPAAIQSAVIAVLTKTSSAQRVATVPIGPLPPALTTEAAQALGVKDVMGTYTAPFAASTARTATVKRAAELLRGQILQPGQVFSLNQVLGARSAANGFVPAAAGDGAVSPTGATGPTGSAQDAGAGNSLLATALFNAEYLAGLKDVEHHPHAVVTDHFPPGMEAAVAYPDVDLKFQNDSGAPLYLWAGATENAVTVAVLGQKAYDSVQTEMSPHYAQVAPKTTAVPGPACVPSDGVPGFQVDVTRILTKSGQDPVRQVFHTSYAAQDRVVCGTGTGSGGPAGAAP
ncbi:MAG: hypothetical protein HOV87_08020, partial [Catenulispora sp.]|nr:hypothetical protein [Catenulispora sp.]